MAPLKGEPLDNVLDFGTGTGKSRVTTGFWLRLADASDSKKAFGQLILVSLPRLTDIHLHIHTA
jgi:hypothetical protein